MQKVSELTERLTRRLVDASKDLASQGRLRRTLDAADQLYVARELNVARKKVIEKLYPDMKAKSFLPFATDIPLGAKTFSQKVFDEVGMAEIISLDADDIPNVDVKATEITGTIVYYGSAYHWTYLDMITAAFAGLPLSSKLGIANKRAMMRAQDEILAFGGTPNRPNTMTGLTGFLNNPNITAATFLTVHDDPATTGEEIVQDLNNWVSAMVVASKGMFVPNTMLLAIYWLEFYARKPYSDQTTDSVLQVFLKNSPHIKNVDSWYRLDTADGGDPLGVIYRNDSEVLEAIIPADYIELSPEVLAFKTKVAAIGACGGTAIYHPLGVSYAEMPKDS